MQMRAGARPRTLELTLLACLLLAPSNTRAQTPPLSFLPLEVGNSWTYVQVLDPPGAPPDTLARGTFTISETTVVDETLYYRLPHPFGFSELLRPDDDGRIWARVGDMDVLLFDFTLADSERYAFFSPDFPDLDFNVTVERNRTVSVIAGRFENTVTLRFDDPSAVDEERSFTFAEGFGIVEAYGSLGDYVELQSADVYPRVDTLDWHGYLPLAIGNVWQYAFEDWMDPFGTVGEWVEEWRIVADSVIGDDSFYVMEVRCDTLSSYAGLFRHSCDPSTAVERYVRYAEEAANVIELRVDEVEAEERFFFFPGFDFRLDAPFFLEHASPAGWGEYLYVPVEDRLIIGGQEVDVPLKAVHVFTAIPGVFLFAHGIGMVHSYFNEAGGTRQELTYARIDGTSYGTFQPVYADVRRELGERFVLETYPNPSNGDLQIRLELPRSGEVRLSLYDMLGRRVRNRAPTRLAVGEHHIAISAQDVGSGPYAVVLEVDGRVVARRSIVIVR